MHERDLDRVIDAAAQQIVRHAPAEALTDAVMTRVRTIPGDSWPRTKKGYGPFLIRWAAISLCAACGVGTLFLLSHSPDSIVQNPIRGSSIELTAEQHRSEPVQPDGVARNERLRRPEVARITRTASPPTMSQAEFDVIDQILFEAIAPQPIDFTAIAIETPLIDRIAVEPIVIEPLSASND